MPGAVPVPGAVAGSLDVESVESDGKAAVAEITETDGMAREAVRHVPERVDVEV